jgi:NAD(P)-dependent dehydrogenase (short-subunit alcohol dehydrogenase family)
MGHELAPLGIQVTAIEPGAFRTNFLDDSSLVTARQARAPAASSKYARRLTWPQTAQPSSGMRATVRAHRGALTGNSPVSTVRLAAGSEVSEP